jgi:hydroxymethylpyrimidine pyrophosphatase-like HAD family hydrolase
MWGCILRAEGGTKGTALAWIARHHNIDIDATVCVGDWLNDVPMMTVAGRSFAMGQSPDAVKSIVSDVLVETSSTGGGIATIARLVFGLNDV